jgi:hypothetical protein
MKVESGSSGSGYGLAAGFCEKRYLHFEIKTEMFILILDNYEICMKSGTRGGTFV